MFTKSRIIQGIVLFAIFLVSCLLFWSDGETQTSEEAPAGYQAQP